MVEWTGVGSSPRSARGLRDPAQPFPAVYTIDASMNFQEALKTLTNETGWTMPKAGADGVFRFHLEDGLDIALHSPDGRLCILTSDMGGGAFGERTRLRGKERSSRHGVRRPDALRSGASLRRLGTATARARLFS